jgi:hypothetical protein
MEYNNPEIKVFIALPEVINSGYWEVRRQQAGG